MACGHMLLRPQTFPAHSFEEIIIKNLPEFPQAGSDDSF
jgi:hypothetical protein